MAQSVEHVRGWGGGTLPRRDDVVVVGAGPYGLSVAAHLRAAGVPVRVFGEVMGSWRHAMATGMFLKSTPDATDLSAPVPGGRLADYRRACGEPQLTELTPIPCDVFTGYGMWFTERYVGDVDERRVLAVGQRPGGLTVALEDGEELPAAAVVAATGLSALAHLPGELLTLAPQGPGPEAALSHTSQHQDLSGYAGRTVAVVGGGQSALESAALLHESGASVQVLVRAGRVRWGGPPEPARSLGRRVAKPASALGPGWSLAAVCALPGAVRRLPAAARLGVMRHVLGPSGGWWLRDRVDGVVPVRTGHRVLHAEPDGAGARLRVARDDGTAEELKVDHVLAATGYRLELERLDYLPGELRRVIARVPGSGAPRLSAAFESSVPGLFFTGSLAAPTFGPVLRFVAGAEYTARRVTARLARGH